eukprot:550476-Amphidinium_carterae.1
MDTSPTLRTQRQPSSEMSDAECELALTRSFNMGKHRMLENKNWAGWVWDAEMKMEKAKAPIGTIPQLVRTAGVRRKAQTHVIAAKTQLK